MKVLAIGLLCIALVSAHIYEPLITREHLEELRSKATYEVSDYETHPFKDWSAREIQQILGARIPEETSSEIVYGDSSELPESFDSRVQWPKCIHPIRDQQQCGSCWAFSASEVLSDRFCIASKGKVNNVLSPQDLVSCDTSEFGCQGGYVNKTWDFLTKQGIVTDACLPYTSGKGVSGVCPYGAGINYCSDKKVQFVKYRAKSNGQHRTISDAKEAISTSGPIEAAFNVYSDFMSYKSGIYVRKSNQFMGGHAVKAVGYGVSEDGTEYWIVANSWNVSWGEKGFFRIKFGECGFESQLWSGVPDLDNSSLTFLEDN